MKVVLTILALLALASAAEKGAKPTYRNLYKQRVLPLVPIPVPVFIQTIGAEPYSIPHQAFLELHDTEESWFCSGSLISPIHVLTAAHCLSNAVEGYVTLGAYSLSRKEPDQVIVGSTNFIIHEDYDEKQIINDIGLLKLNLPITPTKAIQIAPLPSSSDESDKFVGSTATTSGWGFADGSVSIFEQTLHYLDTKVISNDFCQVYFGMLPNSVICTTGYRNLTSCYGDTGGPLTLNGVQVGIVSFGVEKCKPDFPLVYTRVTSYLDWIKKNIDVLVR